MINGIGLAVLLDNRPVDVVLQVPTSRDRLFRVFDRAVQALSHNEHRDIRQSWLQANMPALEGRGVALTASELEWLKRHPGLKVGMRGDWPPFEFEQDGRPAGLASDLVKRLEENLDVRFNRVIASSRQSAEDMLKAGEVDILPGMSRTPEPNRNSCSPGPMCRYRLPWPSGILAGSLVILGSCGMSGSVWSIARPAMTIC